MDNRRREIAGGGMFIQDRKLDGEIAAGKCADFFAINLNRLDYTGPLDDPVPAVVFCAPQHVDLDTVHGRLIIENGQLLSVDPTRLIETHNQAAR